MARVQQRHLFGETRPGYLRPLCGLLREDFSKGNLPAFTAILY
jgi:hypothetical protein